ncbi:hypothetical protein ACFQ5E_24630 [Oceanobacillus sojae]
MKRNITRRLRSKVRNPLDNVIAALPVISATLPSATVWKLR